MSSATTRPPAPAAQDHAGEDLRLVADVGQEERA